MTSSTRRRPHVLTAIAIIVFVAALTLWIVARPDDTDQEDQPIAPVATKPLAVAGD